jgi:hypothetical protein
VQKEKELVLVDSDHKQWHVDIEKAAATRGELGSEVFAQAMELLSIVAKG